MAGTQVLSGLSSSRFIWTNFATSGGNFLVICNGADAVRNYDGTSWSEPAITGVSSSTLSYVFPFKSRLFFIERNTTDAWYLPVDSIAGAANTLTVGAELRLGGTLVAGATLTHDGGSGPDDYCVFVSSEGEVVIYSGTDPDNALTWGLAGVFRIGRPIGDRCLVKTGGDLAVLTQDGIVSLGSALALDRAAAAQLNREVLERLVIAEADRREVLSTGHRFESPCIAARHESGGFPAYIYIATYMERARAMPQLLQLKSAAPTQSFRRGIGTTIHTRRRYST